MSNFIYPEDYACLARSMRTRWSRNEIRIMNEYWGKLTLREIKEKLPHRTTQSLHTYAYRHGLSDGRYWTERENKILKMDYCDEPKSDIMASLPNRHWSAIQRRASSMGLKRINDTQFKKGSMVGSEFRFTKNMWQDKEWAKEILNKQIAARELRPNGPESRIIRLIQQEKLPFRYVGDGALRIGHLNPDFVHNEAPKLIEVFGDYWHDDEKRRLRWHSTEWGRKAYYSQLGYQVLILWEHDIVENTMEVLLKLKEFMEE